MEDIVGHRMILHILDDGIVGFSCNFEVYNTDFGGEDQLAESLVACHEMDLFLTAIHYTGNISLFAMFFSIFFPTFSRREPLNDTCFILKFVKFLKFIKL